jgi:hypothetical protein
MNLNLLLQTPFVIAVRFSDATGTSAPRGVLVVEIDADGKLVVVMQDLFGVHVVRWTVEELLDKTWPNLQQDYHEVAHKIDMQVRLWLPCSKEARHFLDKALMKGAEMATASRKKPKAGEAAADTTEAVKQEDAPQPTFPMVYADYSRRTCLALSVSKTDRVRLIPMSEGSIFDVEEWGKEMFDRRYNVPLHDYPVDKAARLFVSFATETGATEAALDELSKFVNISKKEVEMATAKKAANAAKTPAAKKTAAPAKTAKGAKAAAAPDKTAKAPKAPKGDGAPRDSAASMFQSLLLEGKHTDDQIFQKVAAKFGLDEKKRGYVGWYRNYMRKQGKTVPDPIKPKS